LSTREPKEGKRDSLSFDPLAIAVNENQRNGIKKAIKEHQGTQQVKRA
jgi:hypothetical protein